MGFFEALENRVRPLVKRRELKRLEGADGQTGEKQTKITKKTVQISHWLLQARNLGEQSIMVSEQLLASVT